MIDAGIFTLNAYSWSWWSFPPLISGLFMLTLGIFIVVKNLRSVTCWLFFSTSLATSLWLLSYAVCFSAIAPETGYFWSKNAYVGIYYLALSFYTFTIEITGQKQQRKWAIFAFAVMTVLFPITRTNLFLGGVKQYFWGYYPYRANHLYSVFMIFFMFLWSRCLVNLWRACGATKSDIKKKQFYAILVGYIVLSIACVDFLGKYEIPAYPWGYLPVTIFIFSIFYAIVRYGFLEIETVVHRTALWFLTSALVLLPLYYFWVFYLRTDIPHNAVVLTAISFLLFVLFGTYKSRVQPIIDHLFRRRKYDYQTVLAQLSSKLGSNLDIEAIVSALREEFVESLYVRATHILMRKEHGNTGMFEEVLPECSTSEHDGGSDNPLILPDRHPLCQWMEKRRKSFYIRYDQDSDISADQWNEIAGFMQDHRLEVVVPVSIEGDMAGLIGLERRTNLKHFSPRDLALLENIGRQIGVVMHNAIHHKDIVEKERLDQELSLGREIQTDLLPEKAPDIAGIVVSGLMVPAKEIGGDYYDYICSGSEIDKRLTIAIGDVSGKGVGAGLLMAMAKTAINTISAQETDVAVVLRKANEILYRYMGNDKFMSLLLMQWNLASHSLCYAGAGHEHIILYHRNKKIRPQEASLRRTLATDHAEAFRCGGIVLGMLPDISELMEQHSLLVEPGDKIILYTDGVSEACNPNGDMFTLERLLDAIETYGNKPANELLQQLKAEIFRFMNHAPQHDDITLVVMEILIP